MATMGRGQAALLLIRRLYQRDSKKIHRVPEDTNSGATAPRPHLLIRNEHHLITCSRKKNAFKLKGKKEQKRGLCRRPEVF